MRGGGVVEALAVGSHGGGPVAEALPREDAGGCEVVDEAVEPSFGFRRLEEVRCMGPTPWDPPPSGGGEVHGTHPIGPTAV